MTIQGTNLKDERLRAMANRANVAQFISFAPGGDLTQRYCCIRGRPMDERFDSAEDGVSALLAHAASQSVNIRTFSPEFPKSTPFHYGLTRSGDVVAVLRREGARGLYSIVNETIDVEDGGVSGVVFGDLAEFAPQDTPRCVEKPGAASLEQSTALELLASVYGFRPALDFKRDERVEFSIHPLRSGYRREHTVIWEIEDVSPPEMNAQLRWPNKFSRFLGDKAFGLLMGHMVGLTVPLTTVIGRNVAPFRFGTETGSGETWIRTCPAVPSPGEFTTRRGWLDPFDLLQSEDAQGTAIASVLSQQGVDASYSGATGWTRTGGVVVQGVEGFGDEFMLGLEKPAKLPTHVQADVEAAVRMAADRVGPARIEWVHDGTQVWLVQLHQSHRSLRGGIIYPGQPKTWQEFDPTDGLETLERMIAFAKAAKEGIVVHGDIGLTSHIGDLLRRARVPSRIISHGSGLQQQLFSGEPPP